MIDIDWFKKINDRYGHSAGDEVLKGVARICKESIRDIDIAGRFGGEEFAVVLVECSLDSAFTVAERIRANIESNEFPVDGTSIRCTVSIGIAGNTTEDADLEMVMKRADTALYDAKQAGRNRTCCFTTEERGRVSS
jgi:diguanylate cyclase (GGDEF)-like protein